MIHKKPVLGICLGMQLMTDRNEEGGEVGLEWVRAETRCSILGPDLQAIVCLPPKWYKDFPNNESILRKIYNIYRLLARKEKTSNF
jgi:anthranilate/para-aminobenzoate synthase component II